MPYIKTNEINTYYEEMGFGSPILFLHSSFSRGIISFSSQIYQFQYEYWCLLPDFRGHGRTESPSLKWSSSQIADDMYAFMNELNIPTAHVIGYSLGGTVALYLATRYPDSVRSIVTIGSIPKVTPTILKEADEFEPDALVESGDWNSFIELQKANHVQAHHGDWSAFVHQSVEDWRIHPNISEKDLHSIKVPSLFISGERDTSITDEDRVYIKQHIPNSKVEVIPETNHRVHMVGNKPSEVNKLILDFLSESEIE